MRDVIQLLPDRLSVLQATGEEIFILWSDVYRVHAYNQNQKSDGSVVLCFDFENGEYVEVDDKMDGFHELGSRLKEFLPLRHDYQEQIKRTECNASAITLYSR
jgi:hypothetical protein